VTPPLDDIPGREPEVLSASVSLHVRSLFAAAEKSAAAIRAEAERRAALTLAEADAEARRIREEARGDADELLAARRRHLTELSDAIARAAESALGDLDSAAEARAALDGLVRSLRATAERIAPAAAVSPLRAVGGGGAVAGDDALSAAAGERPTEARPPVEPSADEPIPRVGTPAGAANGDGSPDTARGLTGARLVAFQMAQAGSTRGEVAAHLRRTFALQDAHEVLNDVFSASGSTHRG